MSEVADVRESLIKEIAWAIKRHKVSRKDIAKKMGMSLSNLNRHLWAGSAYTDNVDKLGEIGKTVGEMIKEKEAREKGKKILETVREQLS